MRARHHPPARFPRAFASFATCLAILFGSVLAGSAVRAEPLRDGVTIEATIGIKVSSVMKSTLADGRRDTRPVKYDFTNKFRMFLLRDLLIVSQKAKLATKAGNGKRLCNQNPSKKTGLNSPICASFQLTSGGLVLDLDQSIMMRNGWWKDSVRYQIDISNGDCTLRMIRGTTELEGTGERPNPNIRESHTTGTYAFNGSSCRLLQGRQSY